MWDLIVSVPDHCLSFYFTIIAGAIYNCLKGDRAQDRAQPINVLSCKWVMP